MKKPKMNLQEHNGYYRYDFTWQGIRCHEPTRVKYNLPPRVKIRKHWQDVPRSLRVKVERMSLEMEDDKFDYVRNFPDGAKRHLFLGRPDNRMTVDRFVKEIYEPHVRAGDVQEHTVDSYMREFFGIYIIPKLGQIELKYVRPEHLDNFIKDLKKATWQQRFPNGRVSEEQQPLSVRRQNMIKVRLKQMLQLAFERKYIEENLAEGINYQREEKPDIDPFSPEERATLYEMLAQRWRVYFLVAFDTGMRPSEQVALEWQDVDYRHDKIYIRRQYVKGRVNILKTRESQRDLDMLPTVKEALLSLPTTHTLVFPNTLGGYLDLANMRNRVWYPAVAKADLRQREMYQTRHSFASIMLEAGEKPSWVSQMLGHTSLKMLWERYGRFIRNRTHKDGSAYMQMLRGE